MHVTAGRTGTWLSTLLTVVGYDGFEILPFAPLLLPIAVARRRGARDLLRFVYSRLLDVGPIHALISHDERAKRSCAKSRRSAIRSKRDVVWRGAPVC